MSGNNSETNVDKFEETKQDSRTDINTYAPAETSHQPARHPHRNFDIDFYKIMEQRESRTTIMIRNIPNKFKQNTLLEMINKNHSGKYDYFYLPMDLKVRTL